MAEKLIVHSVNNIKVLSINTWGIPLNLTKSQRLDTLCKEIKKLNPDVVLMQELWLKKDYDKVVNGCGYRYVTPYGPFIAIGKYSGLVTMSKYPIASIQKINYRWKEKYFNIAKGALKTEILFAGQKVAIFNTHLTANLEVALGNEFNIFGKLMFTSDYEEVSRWDQLRTLTEHLNQTLNEGIPIILGGDLNTGPRYPLWCKWMTYMKDNFQDLFDSVSYIKGLPSTFNNDLGHRDQGQLDHIIAFGKAKVIESKVVLTEKHNMCFLTKCEKLFVSDHFGLQSILAIPRSQKCNL